MDLFMEKLTEKNHQSKMYFRKPIIFEQNFVRQIVNKWIRILPKVLEFLYLSPTKI